MMEDWQGAKARLRRRLVPMCEVRDDGGGLAVGLRRRATTMSDGGLERKPGANTTCANADDRGRAEQRPGQTPWTAWEDKSTRVDEMQLRGQCDGDGELVKRPWHEETSATWPTPTTGVELNKGLKPDANVPSAVGYEKVSGSEGQRG